MKQRRQHDAEQALDRVLDLLTELNELNRTEGKPNERPEYKG